MLARSRARGPITLLTFAFALILIFTTAALPARAQVTVDTTNPHFLDYNGGHVLIGMSSEYLPHVTRMASKAANLCTLDNYSSCLANLHSHGLNSMQLWLALNSSTGLQDCNTVNTLDPHPTIAVPYENEQPFFWNGSKWRLDRVDGVYWSHVNQVLTDAGNLGIAVEVTLFDPWGGLAGGTNPSSPWNPANNVIVSPPSVCGTATTAGFTAPQYFASFDNSTSTTDTAAANQCARALQMAFLQEAAQVLNAHTNFYWNIANEVDLVPSGFTAPNATAQLNWINWVAGVIAGVEGSATYPVRHPMAINLTNQTTISLANASTPALDSHIGIINGHYVAFAAGGSVAALPLIKNNFSAAPRPFAFGFTESRSTTCPTLVGARAEAWEFACNEGAVYDNYNLARSDTNTLSILDWLEHLDTFLAPLNLLSFNGPQTGSTPAWASGLPAYGSADGTGTNFYWSASQATRSQYALYMHHSSIPMLAGVNGYRYAPPATCHTFQSSMSLSLGSTTQHFKAEWFFPSTGAVACSQDVNYTAGTPVPVTSPHYNYDLALRLTACSPGGSACAPVGSCSATLADGCPPADPATCPPVVHPSCPTPGVVTSCPDAPSNDKCV